MRKMKRFAMTLMTVLTTLLCVVAISGCVQKGDREEQQQQHVCNLVEVERVNATCQQAGSVVAKCTICNGEKTVSIPKTDHALKLEKGYAATCLADGKKDKLYCTTCSYVDKDQDGSVISSLGNGSHDVECKNKNSRIANCQEQAFCGVCNQFYGEKLTDHTPYLVTVQAKAPTCESNGWIEYSKCLDCTYSTKITDEAELQELGLMGDSATLRAQGLTEGLGHKYIGETCTEAGVCSECNKVNNKFVEHSKAATNSASTKATCTEPAYCGICNEYYGESLGGHVIVYYAAKAPTCVDNGYLAYEKCTRAGCKYTTYEEVEATGHDYENYDEVEPTCTEIGFTEYEKCVNCHELGKKPTIIPALGHDGEREGQTCEDDLIDRNSIWPDCEHRAYCGICNEIYGSHSVAGGHDLYTVEEQYPTCKADGWYEYEKCKVCSYSTYEENIRPKVPHNPVQYEYKAPTCTEDGHEAGLICIYCQELTVIPALGHDGEREGQTEDTLVHEDTVMPSCTEQGYCGICQEYYGEVPQGHVEGSEATCTKKAVCMVCGEEYGETTKHIYSNGECIYCDKSKYED